MNLDTATAEMDRFGSVEPRSGDERGPNLISCQQ